MIQVFGTRPKGAIWLGDQPYAIRNDCQSGQWKVGDDRHGWAECSRNYAANSIISSTATSTLTMRQTFTGIIRGFNSKRYYKSVGLPYSSIVLTDVKSNEQAIPGLDFITEIPYGKSLHIINPLPGVKIQFTAELDSEALGANKRIVFKRPLGFKILS